MGKLGKVLRVPMAITFMATLGGTGVRSDLTAYYVAESGTVDSPKIILSLMSLQGKKLKPLEIISTWENMIGV